MALRTFGDVPYMPVISLRPAEMRALEELPDSTKDALLPIVPLRAWMTAHMLQSGIERLAKAYGDRPVVISISEPDVVAKIRPVHTELDRLRDAGDGYRNWCDFISETPNYIPAVQLRDPFHIAGQLQRLHALGRGVVVIIERDALPGLAAIAQAVGAAIPGGNDVCFVVDLGVPSHDPLGQAV